MKLAVWILAFLTSSGAAHAQFPSEGAPEIHFLTKAEAQQAIVDDSREPYFCELQPLEIVAKTGSPTSGATLEEQREDCRQRYKAAVMEFSPQEEIALSWYVKKLYPPLAQHYPLFAAMPWSFIKVNPALEGGLPHTRGGNIVLSSHVLEAIVDFLSHEPGSTSITTVSDLLIHEQTHVFQRMHRQLFASLYHDFWGFQSVPPILPDPWLTKRHLTNPDAVECNWIFPIPGKEPRWIWPLVILGETNGIPRMPQDFRTVGVELDKTDDGFMIRKSESGEPVVTELLSIPEYRRLFPDTMDIYHPNEASADLFAKIYMYDAWIPKKTLTPDEQAKWEQEYGPLRQWFQTHFQNAP